MKKIIITNIITVGLMSSGFSLSLGMKDCGSLAIEQSSYCHML
ncbi:hypothetical protein [Francisella adeliensis]|nr:hypothetical protein [Francisella adeliensis]